MEIKSSYVKLACIYVPICIGLYFSAVDFDQYQQGLKSLSWQPVQARVQKFRFNLIRLDFQHMSYVPTEFEYTYHVGNTVYRGYRMTFPDHVLTHEQPKSLFNRFGEGKEITVFYDPAKPSKSTQERGLRKAALFWLAFRDALITSFTPLILLYFRIRRKGESNDNPLNFSVD